MNTSIEGLSKEIINRIILDIRNLAHSGKIEFHMTKHQKFELLNGWGSMIEDKLKQTIEVNKPYEAGFDGSSKPNPGIMTIGGWIEDPDGNQIYSFTETHGQGTNNEAEYMALIKIFDAAKKRGIKLIHIIGDSALVVNQVNEIWKTKDPRMEVLRQKVYSAAEGIEYSLEHQLRHFNKKADALTR